MPLFLVWEEIYKSNVVNFKLNNNILTLRKVTMEVIIMAKGKYEYWLTDEGLTLLTGWAREGYTDEQIAKKMGIVSSTFYLYKGRYSEIAEALKKGKEVADYEVENSLFKSACGYWYEEIQQEKLWSTELNKLITVKEKSVRKFIPPNPTSQIFWLKNRNPDKWKDKREETIETNDNSFKVTIENSLETYAD